MIKRFFTLLGLLIIVLEAYSQSSKEQVNLNIFLRDKNIISGISEIKSAELNSVYGKLSIPIRDVTLIEPGLIPDKSLEPIVITMVNQLANSSEEKRKSAYDGLVSMSVYAIPVIADYIDSEKYHPGKQTDYLVEDALEELMNRYSVSSLERNVDVITVNQEFKIPGEFLFKTISVKTDFGQLLVPKEKILKIEVSTIFLSDSGSSGKFYLQASEHINSNHSSGWLKTGIQIKRGQKVRISSTGEITFQSLSGNRYNPDGSLNGVRLPEIKAGEYFQPEFGQVIYKIGENSTPRVAGDFLEGTASQSGMLFLSIYEEEFSSSNTGFYTVSVLTE